MASLEPVREIKPRIMAVRINETDFWTGDIGDDVSFIHAHYLYDENTVTHICSFQKNYDLRFVGFDFEPSREMSDDERSDLWERIHDEYSREIQDGYYGVRMIDRIHEGNRRLFMEPDSNSPPETLESDELLNEAIEQYVGNPIW